MKKININESMNKIKYCPVCGSDEISMINENGTIYMHCDNMKCEKPFNYIKMNTIYRISNEKTEDKMIDKETQNDIIRFNKEHNIHPDPNKTYVRATKEELDDLERYLYSLPKVKFR